MRWDEGHTQLTWLLLAAPLLEEGLFRAGLQESLLRRWPTATHGRRSRGLTTLAFAACHAVTRGPLLGLAVVVPAWFLGQVYDHQRSLTACTLLHALFNLAWWGAAPSLAAAWMPLLP